MAIAGFVVPAHAQSQEDPPREAKKAPNTIVVVARKFEENLQEVPVAVTAFGEEDIRDLNLESIDDLSRFTPGLVFQAAFGRNSERPVIRGQSSIIAGVNPTAESGAAYFIDGVYYSGSSQGIDFREIERVEVIKGPQSALYGRNTYAGAINFITKNPSDEFSGYARAQYGSYNRTRMNLGISGPIAGDILSGRISAQYLNFDGQYRNTVTGDRVGSQETLGIAGSLYFTPSSDLDIRARVNYQEDDDGPLPLFLIGSDNNNCFPGLRSPQGYGYSNPFQYFCGTVEPRDSVSLNTDVSRDGTLPDGTAFDGVERELLFTSLSIDWDIAGSGYTLTSLNGYSYDTSRFGSDSDFTDTIYINPFAAAPNNVWFANTNLTDTEQWSTELRLASPLTDRFRWLAGAYYYKLRADRYILAFDTPARDILDREIEVENKSLFGLVSYDIVPGRLTATLEARYMWEDKLRIEDLRETGEYEAFTPRVTIDFQVNPDILLYAIYSAGAKPGGLNGNAGAESGFPIFDQETSDNYEAGAKTTLFGGAVTANIAAFYTQASEVQLSTSVPTGTANAAAAVTTNQGSARIYGLEVDVSAQLSDYLSAGFALALTDAEFTEGCDPDFYTLRSGGFQLPVGPDRTEADLALCDIRGYDLPLTASTQASSRLQWEAPLGTGDWSYFLGSALSYESSKAAQIYDELQTGETWLLNASAGFKSDRWRISIFAENLLDEDSIVAATRFIDIGRGSFPINNPLDGAPNFGRPPATVDGRTVVRPTTGPFTAFATLRTGRTVGVEVSVDF